MNAVTLRMSGKTPSGVTLIELLAALVLLGLFLGVAGLSLGALRPPPRSATIRALEAAHAKAIQLGRPVTLRGDSGLVRFLPDGRALGWGVDPWTGDPSASR